MGQQEAWGKLATDPHTGELTGRLALVEHCIDVASVFRELCDLPALRRNLNLDSGQELTSVQLDRLAVFALLHDAGKCNLGFQAKQAPAGKIVAGHVRECAPLLFDPELCERMSIALGLDDMAAWFLEPEADIFCMLLAAISHHGEPAFLTTLADSSELERWKTLWRAQHDYDPLAALAELGRAARQAFPQAFNDSAAPFSPSIALQHRFAGLLMLADWLGSHRESFFPFVCRGCRIDWARKQARHAIASVGLDISVARNQLAAGLPDFVGIFGCAGQPTPLQHALANADLPPLIVAESNTGSGKTEAALLHFLALFATGKVDSLYFALPTRVAARELYGRVQQSMQRVFGEHCPPVLLAVPGYAHLDGEPAHCLPASAHLWHETAQHTRERAWAAERPKRFLAAPIAVGTIDQALFAAIQVPHAHLRQACLGRALLVIDEVHSSDVYMRYLCRRLLARHLHAGGRALLLSATLGSAARAAYLAPGLATPAPENYEEAIRQPYPALATPGAALQALPDPAVPAKQVRINVRPWLREPEALLPELRTAIAQGLRVMVVLNTVQRAMTLARLADADPVLVPALFNLQGQACPHHGRFARPDREALDREVSRCMGKHSVAGALLLIGTQTLEQSLDIDADWLVSDLCPMDVLLQRIGRLHRHDRGPRAGATCTVLLPAEVDFAIFLDRQGECRARQLAGLGSVYEDLRILQLTRDLLAPEPDIEIPRDNRLLVEATTHPSRLDSLQGALWQAHAQRIEGLGLAKHIAAEGALIPDLSFGEFVFPPVLEARLSTRLGLGDRTIRLGGTYVSPFGNVLDEINVPGHLVPGLNAEEAHSVSQLADKIVMKIEAFTLHYTRFGLERVDESAV